MKVDVVADGLQFPEGPIAFPDGSILLVEIARGTLTRVWGNGRTEVVADLGGGPNGAAIGPDGAVYVCNNGGFNWIREQGLLLPVGTPDTYDTGRIERVDLSTGTVDRLYEEVSELPLRGPNDLVFDRAGGFWFTDMGKSRPRDADKSGLYYARPDGTRIVEAAYGFTSLNGVGLSPDETRVLAAETATGRLWSFDITGPGQVAHGPFGMAGTVICTLPGHQLLDSLAVEADGRVSVATILNGGITTFAMDGGFEHVALPDPLVTNICFGGDDMRDAWITLSGTGQLVKVRWPRPGLRLNFQP